MNNFAKQLQRLFFVTSFGTVFLLGACSQASSSNDKAGGATAKKPVSKPASTSDASQEMGPEGVTVSCWEKLINKAEADKCSGIYSYSGKTCVSANLKKDASCTREGIAAKYGAAKLNGTPVMDTVDGWIKDGYEANQCATGTDGKLYVYFLKKVFTAKSATDASDHYAIADKRLGPAGATLSSIILQSSTTPSEFVCN